ncbi:MAG: hypothetical protein ACJ72O_00680, partial [Marmoricola sp.]
APDSGTPEQRPPGWQPPPEPARPWAPPAAAPLPPPAAPPAAPYVPPAANPYGAPPPPPAYGQQYGQQAPSPYPPAPYGQQYQPLHQARPVYKPGTIPLRPLGVGDMFSGAVETIRRNPKATLGIAALVLTAFMMVPILGTLAWGAIQGFGSSITSSDTSDVRPEDVGLLITTFGGSILSWVATVVLTGMIVHVVEHAARGQKLGAGEAWKLTKPRVWRLLGLSVMTLVIIAVGIWLPLTVVVVLGFLASDVLGVLLLILAILGGIALSALVWARLFQLAAASVVLEQRNVFASMRRSWDLSRGQFWRIFGIALLTWLVTTIAGQFIAVPFAIIGGVGGAIWPDTLVGVLVLLLSTNVAAVVSGALTTPFSAGVAALQYLDQRIRKEGYDIALIAQVPVTHQPPMPR